MLLLTSGLASMGISHGASIEPPPSSLQEGLVINMGFNAGLPNAYDTYTGYDGVINNWGGGAITSGGGAFDSAGYLNLNGASGSHPGTSSLGSASISANNFSVSFQFKDITLNNSKYFLRMTTNSSQTFQFETINDSSMQLYLGGAQQYVGNVGSLAGTTSDWQSFTMTVQDGLLSLYLDGNLKVSKDLSGVNLGMLSFFQLGCGNDGANAGTLKMDDFSIWNRSLTPDEVRFLADHPASDLMVPEASSASLGLLGLLALLGRRRRQD